MRPATPSRDAPHPTTALAAIGAASAVCTVAWLGLQAACLLGSHRPAGIGLGELAAGVAALPRHGADPGGAWPRNVRDQLPAPAVYWAAQVAVVVALVAATIAMLRRRRRSARGHPLRVRPDAGVARAGELADLHVAAQTPGRLILGTVGHGLVATRPGDSLAVVGPTGCGKTAGFAIPALLEWEGPIIATSVKADLITSTLDHRRGRGKVFVYDPTGAAGIGESATWSPIGACRTWAGAMRSAAWLAEAAQPRRDSVTDGDYWYTQARRGLAPYLFAAGLDSRTMGDVVRWIDGQNEHDIAEVLDAALYSDDPTIAAGAEAAQVVAEGLWSREERLKGSVFSTIENILAPYADPGVVAASGASGLDFADWLAGDNTIYVVATAHEQARLRPVLSVLVQQAVRTAYDTAARAGSGRLQHPLLVMLDEAANIAPLPDLPGYAATARSHGITLVSIWQDLAQLRNLYGTEAQSLLNNHRAKLFGSGIADIDSLDYLSRLIGEQRHLERQHSHDINGDRRSVSEHTSFRRLAPPDLLRRVRAGHAVLIYGAELPAYVALRPWYADHALRRLGTSAV
jgi:type IV secretion system protein VirD4